jgi:hypothetical protein
MGNTLVLTSYAPAELKAILGPLPPAVSHRITELVTKALPLKIDRDHVVRYAFLFTIVEREAQGQAVSTEHATRAWRELVGGIHGMKTGYRDEQEAGMRYRRGRQARALLGTSLNALIKRWGNFQQLVHKHRSELPMHSQRRLSQRTLESLRKTLESMRASLVLEGDVLDKGRAPHLSTTAKTYALWRFQMPSYPDRWIDMYRLAVEWRLSGAKDVETFRTIVMRATRPSQGMPPIVGSTS